MSELCKGWNTLDELAIDNTAHWERALADAERARDKALRMLGRTAVTPNHERGVAFMAALMDYADGVESHE